MATQRRTERRRRPAFPRLGRLRVGTRLLLLLLVPTGALLAITSVANWRDLQQVREIERYQQLAATSSSVADLSDELARERAVTIRARRTPTASLKRGRTAQQKAVDTALASISRTESRTLSADVDGTLSAVDRQLFSLRLRADALSVPALQEGYGQAIDVLASLRRALSAPSPTQAITTAAIADAAIDSVVEAARREQLDVWMLLLDETGAPDAAGRAAQWEPLERAGLNAYRNWAPSTATADLNAALFSPPGLYVREQRERLRSGELETGPSRAAQWWRLSGARLAQLTQVRAESRSSLRGTIAADLSSERTTVAGRLGISLLAVVVGLGLGFLLRRSIARSLTHLAASAHALSGGQLDADIPATGRDEIAAVGEAFRAVRATNQQLVVEVESMNRAIAAKRLSHRADPSAFQGAWADLLRGLNGTMDEVARLHASERRELERQEVFGDLGRRVVSGELSVHEAYVGCCSVLVEHTAARGAAVYEQLEQGWHRRAFAGVEAPLPSAEMHAASNLTDAELPYGTGLVRRIGSPGFTPTTVLAVDVGDAGELDTADALFLDGIVRILDEAIHHHETELERVRTQQVEATGTLAATFAHDFNNVLAAILNHAQLGALETTDRDTVETFEAIGSAATRASEVVSRLMGFARNAPPGQERFDLAELAGEACALVRPGLPSAITLTHHVDGVPAPVVGDPGRIHQVIVNLLTNAAQALGSSPGQITVTVDEVPGAAGPGRDAPHVRLRVHDTGPGIPPAIAQRVFEPFFTTKPEGQGTGLGLASARTIARNHRGTLDLENSPLGGTIATLCLPAAATASAPQGEDRHGTMLG
jgi:signal transduction histidine kinase/HAMP domain-containing protein